MQFVVRMRSLYLDIPALGILGPQQGARGVVQHLLGLNALQIQQRMIRTKALWINP